MNKLLIGFSAGLLVGVLFAPAKGSETRDGVSRRGRDLKEKFNDLVDSISDKFEAAEDEVDEFVARSKRKANALNSEIG